VHIQNTNSQYHLPEFGVRIAKPHLRREAAGHFSEPAVRKSVELDVSLIDHYDQELPTLERYIESAAHGHDPVALAQVAHRAWIRSGVGLVHYLRDRNDRALSAGAGLVSPMLGW
jgi:hypothetical protein